MTFNEAAEAVRDAKQTLERADGIATDMARVLLGRLRKVDSGWLLADLKRELANFDMRTKRWKK